MVWRGSGGGSRAAVIWPRKRREEVHAGEIKPINRGERGGGEEGGDRGGGGGKK